MRETGWSTQNLTMQRFTQLGRARPFLVFLQEFLKGQGLSPDETEERLKFVSSFQRCLFSL